MRATEKGPGDALAFARSYLPGGVLLWIGGESSGPHRIDAFHLGNGENQTLFVLSTLTEGVFIPDLVSLDPYIPYDTALAEARQPNSQAIGVSAWVERVHSPGATEIRFAVGEGRRQAPVHNAHTLVVDWDTQGLNWMSRPRPEALLIDGDWQPTISRQLAATAQDLRRGYRDYYDGGAKGDDWAVGSFYDVGSFGEKVAMVEAILEGSNLSDFAHACLAAGPVEELIGDDLLDYITAQADRQARWIPLLRQTYWHSEPAHIRERLGRLLG